MSFKDRIIDFRRVPASKLLRNPKNWRQHGERQTSAVKGILQEVGIADALIARETPDGLELLNGHLRQDLDPDTVWPVQIVDLNDDEAAKFLATFDYLAGLADTDKDRLEDLLDNLESSDLWVRDVLDDLDKLAKSTPEEDEEADQRPNAFQQDPDIPEMERLPFEHYDYIMLMFHNDQDFSRACELLSIQKTKVHFAAGKHKLGLGRVVDGAKAIDTLCHSD